MNKAAVILALAAGPVFAAPSLEQMKADSGIRFSELSGVGPVNAGPEPVWAGGAAGRRAEFTRADRPSALTAHTPPPPAPPAPSRPKAPATSLGTKLLVGAGYLTGALATAVAGPKLLTVLAVGGGVAAAAKSWRDGDGGWTIAKKTVVGAALGAASIAIVAAAVGLVVGRGLEKLFKR